MFLKVLIQSEGKTPYEAQIEISANEVILGRRGDVRIADETCSAVHASLFLSESGALQITDLGSRNGTRLGGRKISRGQWRPGTQVRLGKASLTLIAMGPSPFPIIAPAPMPESLVVLSYPERLSCYQAQENPAE